MCIDVDNYIFLVLKRLLFTFMFYVFSHLWTMFLTLKQARVTSDDYIPSTFHIGLIFPLCFSGAVNAAHQLGVSSLDVRGAFSLAHQPAPDKHGPDVHLIPLPTVRSRAVRGESDRRLAQKQRRTLGHFWAAYTFGVSRHGAAI